MLKLIFSFMALLILASPCAPRYKKCPSCLSNPHRAIVPKEFGTAEWFAQFQTPEEIDQEICCLQSHIHRLQWRAKMDWLQGMRLLYVDIMDYNFYMTKVRAAKSAAIFLEELIEVLEERKERLIKEKE